MSYQNEIIQDEYSRFNLIVDHWLVALYLSGGDNNSYI